MSAGALAIISIAVFHMAALAWLTSDTDRPPSDRSDELLLFWDEYEFDPLPEITAEELAFLLSQFEWLDGPLCAPVGFDVGPHLKKTGHIETTKASEIPFPNEDTQWFVRFPDDDRPRR